MTKAITAIRRPLNITQKEIEAYLEKGYCPVSFIGENLQPFHAFAKVEDMRSMGAVVRFEHLGELLFASHVGAIEEGWFKKTEILLFEVLDFAPVEEDNDFELMTA